MCLTHSVISQSGAINVQENHASLQVTDEFMPDTESVNITIPQETVSSRNGNLITNSFGHNHQLQVVYFHVTLSNRWNKAVLHQVCKNTLLV